MTTLDGWYFTPHRYHFVSKLTNLQLLLLIIYYDRDYFNTLQYATFSQLQILIFGKKPSGHKCLKRFLERNGKNLKGIQLFCSGNLLNLVIAESEIIMY